MDSTNDKKRNTNNNSRNSKNNSKTGKSGSNKSKNDKKMDKYQIIKFLSIVLGILSVYAVIVIAFFTYAFFTDTSEKGGIINGIVDKVSDAIEPTLPDRTLALVAVTDIEEGRTDTIILVDYNSINNKVTLMSIPRDTKVTVPQDMYNVMISNYPVLKNQSSTMKINAINNYGNERGMEFLKEYIEDMLDVTIDYTALLHIDAVRYLVDSVGGIEFDVPRNMYYSDPTQNLLINLKAGLQLLDGNSAEQLLRFRSYGDGDLTRVEVQQEFIKLFLDKIFSMDSIISNPSAYLTALIDYVETNFKITDALKYIKEINKIDMSNIENYTMPVIIQDGSSYLLTNSTEIKEFAYELFNKETIRPEDIVYESSYHKSIQVLNGSNTSGIAKLTKEYLEDNGYLVSSIGDSSDAKSEETLIYVSKEGYGYDIKALFKNANVVVNPVKTAGFGYDITVVVGTNDEFAKSTSGEND